MRLKFVKTYWLLKIHLVLLFQQRDDKKCVNIVIDSCYESTAQKLNTNIFSSGMSYKGIIVEEEIVSSDHDVGEGEQKDSHQLLSLHFYQKKVEQSTFNIDISEEKD